MRWEACNSTLMAVCSSLLQLAASLSAHHECIIVLLSAQLLGVPSLVPGVFLSSFLRARARWMRLLMTLTAVCAVLLSRTFFWEKSDFAARWDCCGELSFLP